MNQIQVETAITASGDDKPFKISRRGFLGTVAGALVLGVTIPGASRPALAQAAAAAAPGTRVPAFIEIRPDSTVFFRSAFIEGGQGIFTAMAQIVGEELDVDPANFVVEAAPPGPDYGLIGGFRFTGGSFSVRSSYDVMRKLGAAARGMLLQAAAARLSVPVAELSTEPGRVLHAASGRSLAYGEIAEAAAGLPVPETLRCATPRTSAGSESRSSGLTSGRNRRARPSMRSIPRSRACSTPPCSIVRGWVSNRALWRMRLRSSHARVFIPYTRFPAPWQSSPIAGGARAWRWKRCRSHGLRQHPARPTRCPLTSPAQAIWKS